MKTVKLPAVLSIFLFAVTACNYVPPTAYPAASPAQPQTGSLLQSEDDVPRIGAAEAKAAVDSGQAVLVDVRSVESYVKSHAAGAVTIPLENFVNGIGGLSLEKSQWIITYCT